MAAENADRKTTDRIFAALAVLPALSGAFAVNGFKGIEAAVDEAGHPANYNSAGHEKSLEDFPNEVLREIVQYAMRPDDNGVIELERPSGRGSKYNIAVGLLRVNWFFYHEGRRALFMTDIIIGPSAYDMLRLNWSIGSLICPLKGCIAHDLTLNHVTFKLGHPTDSLIGVDDTERFRNAMCRLRSPLRMKKLTIIIQEYTWRSDPYLFRFASTFSMLQVKESLEISGPDVFLELSLRILPFILRMNPQPTELSIQHRGRKQHGNFDDGFFKTTYVAAKHPRECYIWPKRVLKDAQAAYFDYWGKDGDNFEDDEDFIAHCENYSYNLCFVTDFSTVMLFDTID